MRLWRRRWRTAAGSVWSAVDDAVDDAGDGAPGVAGVGGSVPLVRPGPVLAGSAGGCCAVGRPSPALAGNGGGTIAAVGVAGGLPAMAGGARRSAILTRVQTSSRLPRGPVSVSGVLYILVVVRFVDLDLRPPSYDIIFSDVILWVFMYSVCKRPAPFSIDNSAAVQPR